MSETSLKPAVLILEDGTIFHGKAFGKIGTTTGELCFNTGMTGYQEVFTDPSYYGQVLIMNSVHIGNYGVMPKDVESASVKIRGLIGRNLEERYSRIQATDSLQNYLEQQNIVAIEDVDTRALVTTVRTKGAMNCIISSEHSDIEFLKSTLKKVPSMDGLELSSHVSTTEVYHLGDPNAPIRVATNKPTFGICLGHQLLALANGIPTFKMHHGHRGLNHPVRNLITGMCEITTQNHGFGVDPEAVRKSDNVEITHINLNDDSIEGIREKGKPAFSVQYHPEATPGPFDSRYLFDDFVQLMSARN